MIGRKLTLPKLGVIVWVSRCVLGSGVNEAALKRVIPWVFYYLGIIDGMSRCLETFKGLNPEPLNDREWQTELRNRLPPELAALRRPHASGEPAIRIIKAGIEAVSAEQNENVTKQAIEINPSRVLNLRFSAGRGI